MAFKLMIILLFSRVVKSIDQPFNNRSLIGSISCGTSQNRTLFDEPHLYSFTTSELQDITLSLCNSAYVTTSFSQFTQLDLYNNQYQHQVKCSGLDSFTEKQTVSITAICNAACFDIAKSSMTLKELHPGSYYIKISNLWKNSAIRKYPIYTLEMDCKLPTTTLSPSTPRLESDNNGSDLSAGSTAVIIVSIMIVIFGAAVFLRFIYRSSKSDEQEDVIQVNVENVPVPSAPVIDDNVSLMVSVSNDEKEGFGHNAAPGAVFDISHKEGDIDGYDDIVSFFYDKVNIDGYNDIYIGLLIENGFHNLDILKTLTDDNFKAIGIDKLDHRHKIMRNIEHII